ncbi:hypothetical protein GCM10010329_49940 [Streptomyces spiroverticillatus]|uniref:DUF2568 domain-containing protein n=1 Tax=Streptomyces finlayi TaxID=67296 RepID=A0A919CBT0_9ACTN|nr:YrdB family protein [Streptomyces finlayi]GHA20584.1 hypothetical protein GCM10010329_49940 [Streptomyces spiroverticillatus]GHD03304.1 hypothetical protein GCM10010334_50890 [Streptomyces finlayi]
MRIAKPGPVSARRWTPLTVANAALALALEAALLAALFFWGLDTGPNTLTGIALGIVSAALAAAIWGAFLAAGGPKFPLPVGPEIALKLGLFAVGAVALADAGRGTLGVILGGLAVVSVAVEYTAGGAPG